MARLLSIGMCGHLVKETTNTKLLVEKIKTSSKRKFNLHKSQIIRISPMLRYMEPQNPMTCFQGQKVTPTTRKFHLLPALPSACHRRWCNVHLKCLVILSLTLQIDHNLISTDEDNPIEISLLVGYRESQGSSW